MVKCLQFAIWCMLLLRELNFRVQFPIPILADNVAAILIAKSPTHTKYARHISLRTHYIRSILPFRDFILAFVKSQWNFADLNTKACSPDIFRRLSTYILAGLHNFNWHDEVTKTLEEIWQQTKARDDSREMEGHVKQFSDTRKRQRAETTAKERKLLEQEVPQAKHVHFSTPVSFQTSHGPWIAETRSTSSGGSKVLCAGQRHFE